MIKEYPVRGTADQERETAKLLPCVAKLTASKVVSTLPKFSPVYSHSGSNPWMENDERRCNQTTKKAKQSGHATFNTSEVKEHKVKI